MYFSEKVFGEGERPPRPGHEPGEETSAENHKRGPRAALPHQTGERSSLRDLSSPGHRACATCPARATGQRRKYLQETTNAGGGPTSPTKLGSEAPCATCPARVTGRGRKRLQKTINAGPPPTSPTKLGSEAPCATCPARVTGPARLVQPGLPGTKKQPSYWTTALSVGENLFFRAVTSQVSSAPASLTSVFGMGTGGPSRQSTPTCVYRLSRRLSNNTTPFQEMQALFLKKLKKVFISPKTDRKAAYHPSKPARCMAPSTFWRRSGNCFSRERTRSAVSFRAVTPSAGQALFTTGS